MKCKDCAARFKKSCKVITNAGESWFDMHEDDECLFEQAIAERNRLNLAAYKWECNDVPDYGMCDYDKTPCINRCGEVLTPLTCGSSRRIEVKE